MYNRISKTFAFSILGWAACCQQAQAASVVPLYAFGEAGCTDAVGPSQLRLGNDGSFYGTTVGGGSGYGSVIRITTSAICSVLGSFGDENGENPSTGVTMAANGLLYGTTYSGGDSVNSTGVIFSTSVEQQVAAVYVFPPYNRVAGHLLDTNATGARPDAALTVGSDGQLYGSTISGGKNGNGTIFRLDQSGNVTDLYLFSRRIGLRGVPYANKDGYSPKAQLLAASDGNLYGSTYVGGANGTGTIFKITLTGQLTTLYTFSAFDTSGHNADGGRPAAAMIQGSDGALYGVTGAGGANGTGTAFKITTSGDFTVMHSFYAAAAQTSIAATALVQAGNGSLYGVIQGTGAGAYGAGELYQLTTSGTYTSLYSFPTLMYDSTTGNYLNSSGGYPNALVLGADGNLYGSAESGGSYGLGTMFEVVLSP